MNQEPSRELLQSLFSLYNQGNFKKVLTEASQFLKQFPNSIILHNILGATNSSLGRIETALVCYEKAIKIKPDYAEAYNNLGTTLQSKGDIDAAIKSYRKAIEIKPVFAEAYNNIGTCFQKKGAYEEAIKNYRLALKKNPDYAEAYFNIGNTFQTKNQLKKAIESYKEALKIKPNYPEIYYNMGSALQNLVFTEYNPDLYNLISSILDYKTFVRPQVISKAVISLLKFDPKIIDILRKPESINTPLSLEKSISCLSKFSLLLKIMSVSRLPDLDFENLFSNIRRGVLLSISNLPRTSEILNFQLALSHQCFNNEYIYNQSNLETKEFKALQDSVNKKILDGKKPEILEILCLTSYQPLYKYKWCHLINLPKKYNEIITRQLSDFEEEEKLQSKIPVLKEVSDRTSTKVRKQYEKNPYPRWTNIGIRLKPVLLKEGVKELKLKIFDDSIYEVKNLNILLAGCGTGQHAISSASRFQNSKVIAVDLSLRSLAYAKRKTKELGLKNIEYMQADILDLRKLNRKFDLVESSGVLHHMKEPLEGWKVLTDCLKPGGLIQIGLYSKLARKHIIKMRQEIRESNLRSNDYGMKFFRNKLIKSNLEHHKKILTSQDFFSLSTFRDLLFHEQEHQFTIAQIKKIITELGLVFCGFQNFSAIEKFKLYNSSLQDQYDLTQWISFEEYNPDTFIGMYQFWCQKVNTHS